MVGRERGMLVGQSREEIRINPFLGCQWLEKDRKGETFNV
jgi:hypothetical protein